ncbi:MAG TPA: LamG-like jellyroll fold domain-containing protein, partial [Gaiellaceae bacterium]|nr:LamG-like jellyroll fold domain-containing protein [Gaiellaceae bacterium]
MSLPAISSAGIGDSALDLGSSGAYVTFGDPAKLDLAQFTVETWFKRTGTGTPNSTGTGGVASLVPLLTHGAPEAEKSNVDANWILGISTTGTGTTNVLAADFEESAAGASPGTNHPVYGTTVITNNVWHHAAATYDGSTWKLYLDGNLETTLAVNQPVRSDSIQRVGLGAMITSTGTALGRFQGVLDEARVWDHARTGAEILAAKDQELTSGTGLVARWGLDDGTGTNVADSVATAASGTITGTGYSWVSPPTNHAPVATADGYTTAQDAQRVVAAPGVLGNDTDADSNPLTAVLDSTVSHGTLALAADGSFTYTPTTGYSGPDSFTYHANDGTADSNVVTVSLTVTAAAGDTALQLNGSTQYATLGAASDLRSATYTAELWFERTGAGVGTSTGTGGIASAIPLIAKGRAEGETAAQDIDYFLGIDASSGKLVADFEEGQTGANASMNHPLTASTVITNNVWHHAAVTYDGTTLKVYLDGALDGSLTVGQPANAATNALTSVGSALTTTGTAAGFFAGVVDEVRIWNSARTLAQLQTSMDSEITSPQSGLLGVWNLNEGSGSTLADHSGNNLTGAA